jgi:O-antigen/teichoic acid export membrane protein
MYLLVISSTNGYRYVELPVPNPVLYLFNNFYLYIALYAWYYYYPFFVKNNSRYPDKKNLKELLKISSPLIVSYII